MINAIEANAKAQSRNCRKWIDATLSAISKKVEEFASAGLHSCTITIPLYIGAENLYEASDTLAIIANELTEKGYEHYVDENGILVIEW